MKMNLRQLVGTYRISDNGKQYQNDWLNKQVDLATELRKSLDSDYRRVIKSDAFRRLQDKTQVFPLERNDFVRTRLTHSLEVAMHSRDILRLVISQLNERNIEVMELSECYRLLETAALIHDIGNPPFGHFGEEAIRIWFEKNGPLYACWSDFSEQQQNDFLNFEGNAQTIRLLTKLHHDNGTSKAGMKLTATTLDTVIKYTASSDQLNKQQLLSKKVGYFYSEKQVFNAIKFATGTQNKRHPLVFLLEASDDIAYTFSDIEDAYNYGLYSYQDLKQFVDGQTGTKKFLMLEKDKTEEATLQEFLRKTQRAVCQSVAKNFANHYDLIMRGIYHNEIIIEDCDEVKCFQALKNFSRVYVFQTKTILDQEVLGFNIINRLLDEFVPVVLKYEKVSMNKYEERIFNNISESAKALYRREAKNATEAEKDYYRLKMAVDFVCNMTDGYAKKVYDTLFT